MSLVTFTSLDFKVFGNKDSPEEMCAAVQPHVARIFHCLDGEVYATDSRHEFFANVTVAKLIRDPSLECPWWVFEVDFYANTDRNKVWEVSIFDSILARKLKAKSEALRLKPG